MFVIPNCRIWNTATLQCSTCESGYYLSANGQRYQCNLLPNNCLRADTAGNCLSCTTNYILYNNRICVHKSSIVGCRTYDVNTFICTQCYPGYQLDPNTRRCVPQFCLRTNDQGQCLQCMPQYRLSNHLCVADIPNCIEYGFNGRCVRCSQGYQVTPDGLQCNQSDPYCRAYLPNGKCSSCLQGYYLR